MKNYNTSKRYFDQTETKLLDLASINTISIDETKMIPSSENYLHCDKCT